MDRTALGEQNALCKLTILRRTWWMGDMEHQLLHHLSSVFTGQRLCLAAHHLSPEPQNNLPRDSSYPAQLSPPSSSMPSAPPPLFLPMLWGRSQRVGQWSHMLS